MQFKRYFIFMLSVSTLLLGACNLAVVTPTPLVTATQVVIPTNTSVPATSTQTPVATLALTLPTPTLTLFYEPTATQTPSWLDCPLVITRNDTKSGDILHIRRCVDNLEYDLGPFSNGTYSAGPDNKFMIYVTDEGLVYFSKMGEQYITVIINLVKERFFTALNKKSKPEFVISFAGEAPYHKLVLYEKIYKQKRIYELPANLME